MTKALATLDSNTSDICQGLDGKVFPVKDYQAGVTAPPFHVNCRSTAVPCFAGSEVDVPEGAVPISSDVSFDEWRSGFVQSEVVGVTNSENLQFYKPVELDKNDFYTVKRVSNAGVSSKITAYRAAYTNNNIYISQNANVKPKFQHDIDMRFTEVYRLLGVQDRADKPLICIIGFDEMGSNALASFNAVKNTLYVNDKLLELEKDFGAQLACPNNKLSTILHECLHWQDASDYAKKFGKITSENYNTEFVPYLNKICKKKLDKLTEKGYNIFEISDYASSELRKFVYDEAYVEYRVKKLLEGRAM